MTEPQCRGEVRFFHQRKGFGFIERSASPDVFFHKSDYLNGVPEEGAAVEFEIRYGDRGPRAIGIQELDRSGSQSKQNK